MGKSRVESFLHNLKKNNKITLLEKFVDLLIIENKKVNLISRKTDIPSIWLNHIYDSILPCEYYDFSEKTVLDFGTGGGLPGIPLKILFPTVKLYLMDSVTKKIEAIKRICDNLNLEDCRFINNRLEQTNIDIKFDFVLSRSVKMNKKFIDKLLNILKPNGKIILYKGEKPEDVIYHYPHKIIELTGTEFNKRKLVEIYKNG